VLIDVAVGFTATDLARCGLKRPLVLPLYLCWL